MTADAERGPISTQALASRPGAGPVRLLSRIEGGLASRVSEEESSALEAFLEGDGYLHAERILMRLMRARHDAGGDSELAALMFEASLASMEEWSTSSGIQQASHSLDGHECGSDCEHDH